MCLICDRVTGIQNGTNPYFVKELETGYVVIGDHQYFRGYTLLLAKKHVRELHDLPIAIRQKHLAEMAIVSEAVAQAFSAEKMNIESLGNGDAHLHWHLFPRYAGDLGHHGQNGKGPVWWLPFEEMYADHQKVTPEELERLKSRLLEVLTDLETELAQS
ncbi:HIT family protein [Streptococcus sp. S784/96/1]|uniref:HIT family protein n=1 Tax=Streptococcus sp. S784/96/1 TaxID=2653499 RepID=UPI00138970E7|nr:HIT family protein [Streptococcus sp. S784/96/1]